MASLLFRRTFSIFNRSNRSNFRYLSSVAAGETNLPFISSTIGERLEYASEKYGSSTAVVSSEQKKKLSYGDLNIFADNMASSFLDLGIKKGDRLGIWSPNNMEWAITQYATAKAGIILVNINPAYKAEELEYALNLVGCKALVMAPSSKTDNFFNILQKIAPEINQYGQGFVGHLELQRLPELKHVFHLGCNEQKGMMRFSDFVAGAGSKARTKLLSTKLHADEVINIQFTSGTTGFPKGAALSHHNILNNAYFCGVTCEYTEDDKVCIPVPLYHCFGMVLGNLSCLAHGAVSVLPSAAFDPLKCLQVIEEEKCTSLYGVPTMFVAMLNHPQFSQFDVSSLRTGIMAGSLCPETLMKRVIGDLNMTAFTIAYGMTELSPLVTQTQPKDAFEKKTQSVGKPHHHSEIKIVNSENEVVPRGQSGEICARGYAVMKGYWDQEDKTKEVIDDDGWMHTGDLGMMDEEGYILVTGRIKDLIIRGGENISPKEIEDCMLKLEQVEDAQVFGIPDDFYGEVVCCWVKLKQGHNLTEPELRDYCTEHLAQFKVPKHIKFVQAFPLTVTGKIQKYIMREQMAQEVCGGH